MLLLGTGDAVMNDMDSPSGSKAEQNQSPSSILAHSSTLAVPNTADILAQVNKTVQLKTFDETVFVTVNKNKQK